MTGVSYIETDSQCDQYQIIKTAIRDERVN